MITLIVYLVGLSSIFALLEIQIEGAGGWAKNLPTWRVTGTWMNKVMMRNEITGYHTYLDLLVILFLHLGLAIFGVWTWQLEARVIGCFLLIHAIEDFMWFVFNPKYTLRQFFTHEIPWHKVWLGYFPLFYYANLVIGGWLIYWSYYGF